VHCCAYRVLAHAEIQHFLEDLAWLVVKAAETRWLAGNGINAQLQAVIAFSGITCEKPPTSLPKGAFTSSQMFVQRAISRYASVRKDNNGVKSADILTLFVPVGLAPSDFDPAWLGDMSTYGQNRGDLAHKSPRVGGLLWTLDPATELNAVQHILVGNPTIPGISGIDELDVACEALL
jgi:hypothetical protein